MLIGMGVFFAGRLLENGNQTAGDIVTAFGAAASVVFAVLALRDHRKISHG
jgi:hypothetical protein